MFGLKRKGIRKSKQKELQRKTFPLYTRVEYRGEREK